MQHNEYVLKNMFGSFFLATVMSALMRQLGGFTDSIVVTHLVSPDALSVVRIWQPIASCMFIFIGMMSAGASFLSARGIGAQNYDKVNRVCSIITCTMSSSLRYWSSRLYCLSSTWWQA